MKKQSIKQIALCALFAAIIAAAAQISIPTPWGINLTLQTFGVCLCGCVLGAKAAAASTAAYIAIGATGLPVFSSFTGGVGIVLGASGGYLWGFLITAVLCGVAGRTKRRGIKMILMLLSILLCHAAGVAQYCAVTGVNVWGGIVGASLPFLAKDIIIVFLADFIAKKLKGKRIF